MAPRTLAPTPRSATSLPRIAGAEAAPHGHRFRRDLPDASATASHPTGGPDPDSPARPAGPLRLSTSGPEARTSGHHSTPPRPSPPPPIPRRGLVVSSFDDHVEPSRSETVRGSTANAAAAARRPTSGTDVGRTARHSHPPAVVGCHSFTPRELEFHVSHPAPTARRMLVMRVTSGVPRGLMCCCPCMR